jgi:membrane protein DedA with SNARE-associated domain
MIHIAIVYYLVLATLSVLQGPIAVVLGAAAAAATTDVMTPLGIFIAVTIGNTTADTLWYMIGKLGKIDWIYRIRWLRVNSNTIDLVKSKLHEHAPKIVLLAKLSSVFVLPVMLAAGLIRLPWKRWFPTLFLVEIIKNVILILAGYYSVVTIGQFRRSLSVLIIAATILSIVIPWWAFKHSLQFDNEIKAVNAEGDTHEENNPV